MQVCLATVGVLGDLVRNVEGDLLPYCDEIMQLLIHNLGSNEVHRTIKPQVSRCTSLPLQVARPYPEVSRQRYLAVAPLAGCQLGNSLPAVVFVVDPVHVW